MLHINTVRKNIRRIQAGEKIVVHQDIVEQIVTEARRQGVPVKVVEHRTPDGLLDDPLLRVIRLAETTA